MWVHETKGKHTVLQGAADLMSGPCVTERVARVGRDVRRAAAGNVLQTQHAVIESKRVIRKRGAFECILCNHLDACNGIDRLSLAILAHNRW